MRILPPMGPSMIIMKKRKTVNGILKWSLE